VALPATRVYGGHAASKFGLQGEKTELAIEKYRGERILTFWAPAVLKVHEASFPTGQDRLETVDARLPLRVQ
jgi:hypothetical protein